MKPYKKLKSRKKVVEKRSTVHEMHDTKMNEFQEYYATVGDKRRELEDIRAKYEEFSKMSYQDQCSGKWGSDHKFREDIRDLEKEIFNMENQTEMLEYLNNVSSVFLKMHNKVYEHNTEEQEYEGDSDGEDNDEMSEGLKNKISTGIMKYINITKKINREEIVDEYINAVNGVSYTPNTDTKQDPNLFKCPKCNIEMFVISSEALIVCKKCGITKPWQNPDTPEWSDQVDFSKTYRYKKLGYFIEHLYRMQARECAIIPEYVINNVMMKLKEKRVRSNSSVDKKIIKLILKELNMTSYYDNINSIIRTISGKDAPKFPEELEDKLICMFMRTLEPFEKFKHLIPSRSNYLSYPYAIRKLLEIISEEDQDKSILEFTKFFSLLKSRNKTWEHERVWSKICEENSWPFIRSI